MSSILRHSVLRPRRLPYSITRRKLITIAEERAQGELGHNANEGILYFDNLFPIRIGFWDVRQFLIDRFVPMEVIKKRVESFIPPNLINMEAIQSRVKDGGLFLKYSFKSDLSKKDIENKVQDYMRQNVSRYWMNFKRVNAFTVQGTPWIEDLHRVPSGRLRVLFDGPAVSEELLYAAFRKYGQIVDITPANSTNNYAILQFFSMRSASAARNCMYNASVEGTRIKVLFEARQHTHTIKKWIVDHPRISIPIGAALLATLTVAIFDPVRTFFVKNKVTRAFHLDEYRIVKWIKRHASIVQLRKARKDETRKQLFKRPEAEQNLKNSLNEAQETFTVVQGPRGSGKRELVLDDVLKDRKNLLIIDCEPLVEQHSDSSIINSIASQVGYVPVFSWLNSMSSMIDLAAQGVIGTKTGFSETLETQFKKILATSATALKDIALEDRKDPTMRDEEYLELHPERRPVVVIDNFMHKSDESKNMLYESLANWAGLLVEANIAHVIFLTNDIGFSRPLSKAIPDRVFNVITLGDSHPDKAAEYVNSRLTVEGEKGLPDDQQYALTKAIDVLGGRLTDLDILSQRIHSGEHPEDAVKAITEQCAAEILKLYFSSDSKGKVWQPEQAWRIVDGLSQKDELLYNDLLLDTAFSSDGESALGALEQAEFINIVQHHGRPSTIKAGRPVYKAAFKNLTNDAVLKAKMTIACSTQALKKEEKKVQDAEDELVKLSTLPKITNDLYGRQAYLHKIISESQTKIEAFEKDIGDSKKILKNEM